MLEVLAPAADKVEGSPGAAPGLTGERPAIDYLSVADPESLVELETIAGTALLSVAVRIGGVRLIDNMPARVCPRGRPPL